MAENAVASFVALHDKDERLQALRSIVQTLSLDERNEVNTAISQRNDILSRLPFELALLVFSFLNPLDTWTLRSVSKQWNTLLSTSEFQQGAVENWSTHRASDRVQPVQTRTLQYEIRHMQAFQTGRPFSRKMLRRFASDSHVQLQGRHLVHARLGNVFARDLCSGSVNEFKDEARETPSSIILTHTVVAFTTVGGASLYWTRLDGSQARLRRVRLPSANIYATGGDGDHVVLLSRARPGASSNCEIHNAIVFDASTSQLRSVDLQTTQREDGPLQSWRWQIIVSAERQIADAFCVPAGNRNHQDTLVHHFRFALDECMVEEDVVRTRHASFHGTLRFSIPRNAGHRDIYVIELQSGRGVVCSFLFDADEGVRTDEESLGVRPGMRSNFAHWKDSVFLPTKPKEHEDFVEPGSFGDFVCAGQALAGRYKRLSKRLFDAATTHHDPRHCYQLLANDSFLVAVEGGIENECSLQVLCFEEDVQMPGGRSTGLWDEDEQEEEEKFHQASKEWQKGDGDSST